MNTPEPCCYCKYCKFDPLFEDDPNESAYCIKHPELWGKGCKDFKCWQQNEKRVESQRL